MENRLEKFSPEKSEEKNKREKDNRLFMDDLLDKIQNYIDFLNKTGVDKALMLKYGFNYLEVEKAIEKNLLILAEQVNCLVKEEGMPFSENSSLSDIVGNSTVMDLKLVINQIKNVRETVKQGKVEGKISKKEYKSENKENLIKLEERLNRLKNSLNSMFYYIKALCDDEEKLKMELSNKDGYLDKFGKYFEKYPTCASKIAYFKFFNEWEQESISKENLEKELEKLKDDFVVKEKIKNDFGAEN